MTIRRAPDDERGAYTIIDNSTLQDKCLTWEARGMLAFLLSKPSKWSVQVGNLVSASPNAKRDKVYALLSELETAGYIVTKRMHDDEGRFTGIERWVYELPQPISGISVSGESPVVEPETPEIVASRLLCEQLNKLIVENGYKPFTMNKTSISTMSRIMTIDKQTQENVSEVIRWSQWNEFWLQNIRSPEKLRKHFDTLRAQMNRDRQFVPKAVAVQHKQEVRESMRRIDEMTRTMRETAVPMPADVRRYRKQHD